MRLTLKTLKLATSLILLSSLIALTACDDILTSQPTHTVNKQYNSSTETYAYDSRLDHFDVGPTTHQQTVIGNEIKRRTALKDERELQLRHYQQERARLEREAHESQLALERAKNAADRTRLEQEARLRMEKAERMQAEENAAAVRQAKEAAERQKALEARNNALQIQRDREAKQRAIDAQIASDRALAERLQREEVEAFQRQQAEIRKPSVSTSQVESMRAPAFDPAPVQASPSIMVPSPTAATVAPQAVTVTETSATPKSEAIEASSTVDNGSIPMAQSPTVVAQ